MTNRIMLALALTAFMASPAFADEPDLEGVKCVVNSKAAAKAEASAEYKEGTVYFCCNVCAGKFKADPEKFAASANHQLVASKQYKQKACPLTGNEIDEEAMVKVGKVEVGFCCGQCKAKVEEAEADAQVNMVFAKAAFEKGFEPVEEEIDLTDVKCPIMGEDADSEVSMDYKGGKVYFCCKGCVAKSKNDMDKYAAKLNMQLVKTKQFAQISCPFSGGKVKDGTAVAIGDIEVGFCCNSCQGKVAGAEDDETRLTMVFNDDAFKKGFDKQEDE